MPPAADDCAGETTLVGKGAWSTTFTADGEARVPSAEVTRLKAQQ